MSRWLERAAVGRDRRARARRWASPPSRRCRTSSRSWGCWRAGSSCGPSTGSISSCTGRRGRSWSRRGSSAWRGAPASVRRPRLALTLGDPAGIGPEIVLQGARFSPCARTPSGWSTGRWPASPTRARASGLASVRRPRSSTSAEGRSISAACRPTPAGRRRPAVLRRGGGRARRARGRGRDGAPAQGVAARRRAPLAGAHRDAGRGGGRRRRGDDVRRAAACGWRS